MIRWLSTRVALCARWGPGTVPEGVGLYQYIVSFSIDDVEEEEEEEDVEEERLLAYGEK